MDVATWLRNLGLEQYEAAFHQNAVDFDILPRLTADDLKDLGVVIVGHRRKLLDAISDLRLAAGSSTRHATSAPPSPAPHKGALEIAAERRPITVMFCDLVGSTGIATRLDAEDWRNLVNAYLDEASSAVALFGGHVLKKLGDGLMALFGYPRAQENDAERGVRAALAIQRALAELNARNAAAGAPELAARIGLESGPVVVDSAGEVFGEAPNIAARVQAAAEPGVVFVTSQRAASGRGPFRRRRQGRTRAEGSAGAGNSLSHRARQRRRPTNRRTRPDAARRTRRGPESHHAAMGTRTSRRRAVRAGRGRARHRQVAHR